MQVVISPVDLTQKVDLPAPWPQLIKQGFHADLIERAKGFKLQADRLGFEEIANEYLGIVGESFQKPFDPARFSIGLDDADRELKQNILKGLSKLSQEFGDRVPTIVWDTLAFLGTRPNPTGYATILASAPYLQEVGLHWAVADTVLHGLGKVYGLKSHVDSVIFDASGVIFEHNCDCGCAAQPVANTATMRHFLPNEPVRRILATGALLSHLLSEALLIMGLKMPFEMGLSPEAAEVLALDI